MADNTIRAVHRTMHLAMIDYYRYHMQCCAMAQLVLSDIYCSLLFLFVNLLKIKCID